MPRKYRITDHTADIGLHVFGDDPRDLFTNAARAMFDIIAGPSQIENNETLVLKVTGSDWPDLMVNWLRELLYLWSGKELLVGSTKVDSISEKEIMATISVERFDPDRHTIKTEIKAVTYHQIRVDCRRTGWQSRIIFDV